MSGFGRPRIGHVGELLWVRGDDFVGLHCVELPNKHPVPIHDMNEPGSNEDNGLRGAQPRYADNLPRNAGSKPGMA